MSDSSEAIYIKKYIKILNSITDSCRFRKLHDKFEKNTSLKNYNKLIKFLKFEDSRFFIILKSSTSLLTDNKGVVIFNSILNDDFENINIDNSNSFNNYNNGKITFDNIYQIQASTMANKMGTSELLSNFRTKGKKTRNIFYISKHVGSSYTAGADQIQDNLGCNQSKNCTAFFTGKCIKCQ